MTAWWVHIDFGSDHRIVQAEGEPSAEWIGPFATFTDARLCILSIGSAEVGSILDRQRWWRTASKAEILEAMS